jgi:ComF family protein
LPALPASLTRLAGSLLDLVFPPRCAGCRRPGTYLCADCRREVQWQSGPICPVCGRKTRAPELCAPCRDTPLPLDGIRSAVEFSGPVRRAVHALKYRGRRELAPALAELMLTAWRAAPLPAELIVPVPLHAGRLAARGYNQAALLAEAFARGAGLPCEAAALERTRATSAQVELGARDRRRNVADAFHAQAARVAGRHVLLIDDVCTTGATLGACGGALRAAGCPGVWAFTLARAHWDPELDVADDKPGDTG